MADQDLRELQRQAAAGDPEAEARLTAHRQRTCRHRYRKLGIFSPGYTDLCGEHADENQVLVRICWDCLHTTAERGSPLCHYCGLPGLDDLGSVLPEDPSDPELSRLSHRGCAAEFGSSAQGACVAYGRQAVAHGRDSHAIALYHGCTDPECDGLCTPLPDRTCGHWHGDDGPAPLSADDGPLIPLEAFDENAQDGSD